MEGDQFWDEVYRGGEWDWSRNYIPELGGIQSPGTSYRRRITSEATQ